MIINIIIFIFNIQLKHFLIILGNKSESKGGSKEEIQVPPLVGFINTGAIPKSKSVKDGKIHFILSYFISSRF